MDGCERWLSTTVQITASAARGKLNLRVGELVGVRSEEGILAALGVSGELDSLQFMPETLQPAIGAFLGAALRGRRPTAFDD
jgi:hypothetical protein